MPSVTHLLVYLIIGAIGGLIGAKTRIPSGALLGSVLAVIIFKMLWKEQWEISRNYGLICQIILGVLIASTYQPGMYRRLGSLFLPMVISTMVIVAAGFAVGLIYKKIGLMDWPTAYIATSPGAMNALVPMAIDVGANAALVAHFHFFRILFVAATAPIIFKILG